MTALARRMGFVGALLITLSAATPASSVFVIVPEVVAQAGTGALWSLLAAAVVAVSMGLVYAELASAYPLTGGEYAIVGHVLGPAAGFVILGVNIATLILSVAALALGVSDYLGAVWPGVPPVPVAVGVVGGATGLCMLNIRVNAVVTGLFLGVELLALAVVAALGFAHVERPLGALLVHPVALGGGVLHPAPLVTIGLAVTVAVFAFDGYGSAVYLGEETTDAPRQVARAVLWALAVTVAAELVAVAAMLMGAPDLRSFLASKSLLTSFVTARGGVGLTRLLSVGVALAIVNAVIAILLLAARQLYSTGRDRVWSPAIDRALTRVHPRLGSPWVATLAAGGLSAAACLIDLPTLLVATGTGIVAIYAALCVAVLVRRGRSTEFAPGSYRMPFHPAPALVCLAVLAAVVLASATDTAVGRPSLLFTAGVMGASALYYAVVLRRRGVWRITSSDD